MEVAGALDGVAARPRMRVFGGPNGSGKSTIPTELKPEWIGVFVNADEIEKTLKSGPLDLAAFQIADRGDLGLRLRVFLRGAGILRRFALTELAERMALDGTALRLDAADAHSYAASAVADFIRRELLAAGVSFTFETVMSSDDKIDFMREAQQTGYRTYLYFVATEAPRINIERVRQRVSEGGHAVPERKIEERYGRSIALLGRACGAANRAYVFDNSGDAHRLIAEVTDGETLRLHTDLLPQWFVDTDLWRSFQEP